MSADEHLKAAFAALLKGDLAERDRQAALAEAALNATPDKAIKRLMEIDFFVTPRGTVIPAVKMMPRA
jgi:hypothetical protein